MQQSTTTLIILGLAGALSAVCVESIVFPGGQGGYRPPLPLGYQPFYSQWNNGLNLGFPYFLNGFPFNSFPFNGFNDAESTVAVGAGTGTQGVEPTLGVSVGDVPKVGFSPGVGKAIIVRPPTITTKVDAESSLCSQLLANLGNQVSDISNDLNNLSERIVANYSEQSLLNLQPQINQAISALASVRTSVFQLNPTSTGRAVAAALQQIAALTSSISDPHLTQDMLNLRTIAGLINGYCKSSF